MGGLDSGGQPCVRGGRPKHDEFIVKMLASVPRTRRGIRARGRPPCLQRPRERIVTVTGTRVDKRRGNFAREQFPCEVAFSRRGRERLDVCEARGLRWFDFTTAQNRGRCEVEPLGWGLERGLGHIHEVVVRRLGHGTLGGEAGQDLTGVEASRGDLAGVEVDVLG